MSALPSTLLAEAQMLRDRAMSHYQARSLFGSSHRLNTRRNGLGFDRHTVMDRGVGVTLGRRAFSALADSLKLKEIEGEPLLDAHALKALIRLLRLAQVVYIPFIDRNKGASWGTTGVFCQFFFFFLWHNIFNF